MTNYNIISSSILLISMLFLSGGTTTTIVSAKLLRGGDARISASETTQQQSSDHHRSLGIATGELSLDFAGNCVFASFFSNSAVSRPRQECIDAGLIQTTAPTMSPAPTEAPINSSTQCEEADSISGYRFFPAQDSQGFDIGPGLPAFRRQADLANDLEALANRCTNEWTDCVAFNTDGWFKNYVRPMNQWDSTSDLTNAGFWIGGSGCAEGLYVKESYTIEP